MIQTLGSAIFVIEQFFELVIKNKLKFLAKALAISIFLFYIPTALLVSLVNLNSGSF